MKLKLILIACLITATVQADELPSGCYVAFSNPSKCFESVNGDYGWRTESDRRATADKYGFAVEAFVNEINIKNQLVNACVSDYADLVKQYNEAYALAKNNYDAAIRKDTIIKKLRRACGSKCRRIK